MFLNRKNILSLLIILIPTYTLISQEINNCNDSVQIIEIKEYYDGKGAIFPASTYYFPKVSKLKEKFTPKLEEVIYAEKLIYDEIEHISGEDQHYAKEMTEKLRKKYYRQYFGYIEPDGSKIIINII